MLAWVFWPGRAGAQSLTQQLTLANPHWNITLSDFGYSDFLLDNTPGLEGREYLSGEWGAAVAYTAPGAAATPQWLEPNFAYPDWQTGSPFVVSTPITQVGLNADGLPIAESVLTDSRIEVTLRHEMVDTVVGTPMGAMAASAGGTGAAIDSDRYVLKQTCTIRNLTAGAISNVQFFQLLHGLNAQRGVFDNRPYSGPLGEFQYDATEAGVDPWATGANTSTDGLEDFLGFHAAVAPTAFEIGHYGIETVDNHSLGKPSDGVHLSIENNWSSEPFLSRKNTDFFAPANRWVAAGQRWDLGTLAPGQSASIEVILSLRTGTRVATGTESSGGCNGGAKVPGGVDYSFQSVDTPGSCFAAYSQADAHEIATRVSSGEFEPMDFPTPGGPEQIWKMEFSGSQSGDIVLTFAYDPTILPAGYDESALCVYQSQSGTSGSPWSRLVGTVDPVGHTIQVKTTSLSSFALGAGGATYAINATADPADGGSVTGGGDYGSGANVTLVATANPGFVFGGWMENGLNVGVSPSLTFAAQADRNLVAHFVEAGTGIVIATASSPAYAGSTTGDGSYPQGASVTVTATPNAGYKFSKWVENGLSVSTSRSYTFGAGADRVLTAVFKPVYIITATAEPAVGDNQVEVDPFYEPGDTAKLKANAGEGYTFVNWTQNGLPVSWNPIYYFTVTGNRTLVANFAETATLTREITTDVSPIMGGSTTGAGLYSQGASVTVNAAPALGYTFANWTEGTTVVSTSASYTFTVMANRTLVANFTASAAYLISTSASPTTGGSTTGDGTYSAGAIVTATATPNAGYAFANWTEGGSVVNASATYAFSATANRTLVANFAPITYAIATSSSPAAGGSTSGSGTYNHGANVTLTATPNAGYSFANWTEGGTVVSTSATYAFSATANRTLVANFVPVATTTYTITTSSSPTAGGSTRGGGSYTKGASVTVVATANTGYAFAGWMENGRKVSSSASYTFTAQANRNLVASFKTTRK